MKKPVFLLISLILFTTGCRHSTPYKKLSGLALGTQFHITYRSHADYRSAVDSIFRTVNDVLSTYHKHSLISRFNRSVKGIPVKHPYFKEVFAKARQIYTETGGYFDPSIGILVNAWDFGPGKHHPEPPDSSRVKKLLEYTGFDKFRFHGDSLYKPYPEMFLDFNAIAKGYTVDLIGRFLEQNAVTDYMVEIGGEIRTRGNNSGGNAWIIGIEKPETDGSRSLQTQIQVHDKSIATSGNYRKFRYDNKGRKIVHTLNPKTGFPEINDLLSASVITQGDCADADAYATACMVMGFHKAETFINRHPELSAVLIYTDENGRIQTEKIRLSD